jgi:hypothetical protein
MVGSILEKDRGLTEEKGSIREYFWTAVDCGLILIELRG